MADVQKHTVVIIGAGPSALAAAVYTTREDIDTALIEKGVIGGLAAVTDWIDNYPGFAKGISGLDLSHDLQAQAERFGAKIILGEVTKLTDMGDYKELETTEGMFQAKAVLISTGSSYKSLSVAGEQEFYGRGVHYCATCDGAFYRDKKLAVVGGGNSAVQEGLFLTKYASHIDMLVRSELKASEILLHELDRAVKAGKITVHLGVETNEIAGVDNKVTKVLATQNGKPVQYDVDGVFVFIGLYPNTEFLKGSPIKLDERGFVLTNENLQTNVPGVFCSGDVRSHATMQIASAVGEGATAALKMREYLENLERKTAATTG